MLVYHGTSADNLVSIFQNGLVAKSEKIWNPSLDQVYVWSDRYIENNYDQEDVVDKREILISQAMQSAACAAAVAKDCRLVVIICDVPKAKLQVDNSCPNMQDASCVDGNIPQSKIVEILISEDLGLIKGYFIASMLRMELFGREFSHMERLVAKAFEDSEFYTELEELVNWRTFYKKEKKVKR
jgi:hypothetical protein